MDELEQRVVFLEYAILDLMFNHHLNPGVCVNTKHPGHEKEVVRVPHWIGDYAIYYGSHPISLPNIDERGLYREEAEGNGPEEEQAGETPPGEDSAGATGSAG